MTMCLITATVLLATVLIEAKPHSKGTISMPPKCLYKDFCFDKHKNYPKKLIDSMLEKTAVGLVRKGYIPKYGDREADDSEEQDCEKETSFEPIHHIVDNEGRVRVVVQSEEKFMQILKVEQCLYPGPLTSETIHFGLRDINDFNITCVDKALDFNFLVLTLDWEGMEFVRSRNGIPVCCSCRYQKKG